ncbi:hypothetical protein D3C80_1952710 [compost metagenome]
MQASGNGIRPQIRRRAILERVEHDEDNGCVRYVDEAIDRQPRKGNHAFNTGFGKRERRHLFDHRFGAVQRGSIRQLGNADQVIFVLHRYEARRHGLEAEIRQPE